jgi:diguanylate cyclase (GGDEF)-like protein/PAS domain S-box-containing protein
MVRALVSVATGYDWRLVALAGAICLLAGGTIVLFAWHARANRGNRRPVWLALTAATAGLGIWLTYIVALLAAPAGVPAAYGLIATLVSALLIAAAGITLIRLSLVAARTDEVAVTPPDAQTNHDAAIQNIPLGLCMFDREGRIVLFNERYARLMQLDPAFLRGRSLLDLFKERKKTGAFQGDPQEFFARVRGEMHAGRAITRIMEAVDGRSLRVVDQPMPDGGWIATFEDITEWRKAESQIVYMARHDPLTALPNRTVFREAMEQTLRRLKPDEQLSVLCLDLDHFKDVNDTLGHPVGDELLKSVTQRIMQCVRETDLVARLGGDEFAIVHVAATPETSGIAQLASRLVDVLAAPYLLEGHQVVVGVSIGVSVAPADSEDPDQLLKNADMAMYRAKGDGRGTYRFFEPGMDARAQARRILELELRTAVRAQEFDIHYQPIRDLRADRITGVEALVRWKHPLRGIIAPAEFIPLAEATGLIVPIGDWVLRRACADACRWPENLSIAVNLSPVQFRNRNLIATVKQALADSGLAPERLELEITESVLLQDGGATLERLHTLRKLGVRISMDDFGTGYSSLSYLRSFPFDKIKIDRSFIHELATREDSMAIVRAVTGLGKSLGIATTAEGVETTEQLEILRNEGCTEVQGYLFSPPIPLPQIERLLTAEQAVSENSQRFTAS